MQNHQWKPANETAHTPAQVFEDGDYGSLVVADVFGDSYEARAARARLIAASPKLLNACKAVVLAYGKIKGDAVWDALSKQLQEAIAEAELQS